MKRERKFHPIGQGAFYTERHYYAEGKEFNVVFDCGSDTKDSKIRFEDIIKKEYPKANKEENIIDILFISHFHADHINQIYTLIKYCTIKNVVIPLLDEGTKALIKIENYLESEFDSSSLIDDPFSYFNKNSETRVIGVKEWDNNQQNRYVNDKSTMDISRTGDNYMNGIEEVDSGTHIISSKTGIDWLYIPYNYNYDENNKKFMKVLKENSIELTDIDTIEKIEGQRRVIKKCYEELNRDLNKISMILYSGNNEKEDICCCRPFDCRCFYSCNMTGCLYFGDLELTEDIAKDIVKVLSQFIQSIQIIQVPHHGSEKNKVEIILPFLEDLRCAVISYGIKNKDEHPSNKVLCNLIRFSIYPHLVTERKHSGFIQEFY